jgi:hypothetical protein
LTQPLTELLHSLVKVRRQGIALWRTRSAMDEDVALITQTGLGGGRLDDPFVAAIFKKNVVAGLHAELGLALPLRVRYVLRGRWLLSWFNLLGKSVQMASGCMQYLTLWEGGGECENRPLEDDVFNSFAKGTLSVMRPRAAMFTSRG